jgi:hypothetical protein
MIRLLVKGAGVAGLAMHIADATGAPLCRNNLKLSDWHIEEYELAASGVICAQCRRIQAAQPSMVIQHTEQTPKTSTNGADNGI